MNISINAVLAHCILFYFQYFLQLTLELVSISFIFTGAQKKMIFVLSLVHALKQQLNELINGKSQTNWDQNKSQEFRVKPVRNPQKTLKTHWYLLYWIHYN